MNGVVARGCRIALFALIASASAAAAPSVAAAQSSLAVLGLVSEEGDDDLASAFTGALRAEATADGSYEVSSTNASLTQMTMAQDCEISEPSCRQAIGEALKAEHVIYGSVRRAGSRGHAVEAHMFDSGTGGEVAATRTFSETTASESALAAPARELLHALTSPEQSAPPSAASGDSAPPPVPTVAPNVAPLSDVESRDQESPTTPASQGSNDWLGYTLIGLGAASMGMTVFSWIQVDQANQNSDLRAYRTAVPPNVDDACKELDSGAAHGLSAQVVGNARDACSKGKTFDVLQYVFIGTAAVATGFGLYFLLDDESPPDRAERSRLSIALAPRLSPEGGGVSALVRF